MPKLNELVQSKTLMAVVFLFAVFIILLFVFKLGIMVGERKAEFSCAWGENYQRNFGGPKQGFFGNLPPKALDRQLMPTGSAAGPIIQVNISTSSSQTATLVVQGQDEIERQVLVDEKTIIKRYREDIEASDLKTGEFVVVIGKPNDQGQIQAELIRVMPPQPTGFNRLRQAPL